MKTMPDRNWSTQRWTAEYPFPGGEGDRPYTEHKQREAAHPVSLKKILVPVDFSMGTRKALAKLFSGTVCLLYVVERPSFMSGMEDVVLWQPEGEIDTKIRSHLRQLASHYFDHSEPVEVRVEKGSIARTIVRVAQAAGCDLIILATRGWHGWRRLFAGKVVRRVMRNAPCPVLMVQSLGLRSAARGPAGQFHFRRCIVNRNRLRGFWE